MTAENYDRCLSEVFKYEGGFVNNPKDPGGATNFGITRNVLAAHRGHVVSVDDVRNMKRAEAAEIYRAEYWNAINGDALPAGVDLAVLDYAVNSGVSRAVKALQTALGQRPDGHLGIVTMNAVQEASADDLVRKICGARLRFMRSLGTFSTFGEGWTRRVNSVQAVALSMAGTGTLHVVSLMDNDPPAKAKDEDQSVGKSTSGKGSILAISGTVGTAATDAADKIAPLGDVSVVIKCVFVALLLLGVSLGLYATVKKARSPEAAE